MQQWNMARFCVETLQHTLPLLRTGESLLSLYSESLQMFLVLFFKLLGKSESPQTSAPDMFQRFDYSSCSLVSPRGCLREDEGFPEGT